MKKAKNNLDERQEQILLQIEHRCFYLAYWGIFALLLLQIVLQCEKKAIISTTALFLLLSFYTLISELRAGIWSRHLKPTVKTNLLASLIAGCALFLFELFQFTSDGRLAEFPVQSLLAILFVSCFAAVLCLVALQFCAMIHRKRTDFLENKEEE